MFIKINDSYRKRKRFIFDYVCHLRLSSFSIFHFQLSIAFATVHICNHILISCDSEHSVLYHTFCCLSTPFCDFCELLPKRITQSICHTNKPVPTAICDKSGLQNDVCPCGQMMLPLLKQDGILWVGSFHFYGMKQLLFVFEHKYLRFCYRRYYLHFSEYN